MLIELDLDAFPGEEALLLGDEQRPIADPDQIADPQRLGLDRVCRRHAVSKLAL